MLYTLLIALIVFISSAFADSNNIKSKAEDLCSMPEINTGYPIATLRACLDATELETRVVENTWKTLENLLEMNVFLDVAMNPPAPYNHLAMDLKAELKEFCDNILSKMNDETIVKKPSAWEFHEGIAAIVRKLKDAHTVYAKPGYFGHFRVAFPLVFEISENAETTTFILPPSERQVLVERYNALYHDDPTQYVNKPIKTINSLKPLEYIKQWSNEVVYASKSVHGRINHALTGDFYLRTLKVYGADEENISEKPLDIEFEDGTFATLRFFTYTDIGVKSSNDCANQYRASEVATMSKKKETMDEQEKAEAIHKYLQERFQQRKFFLEFTSEHEDSSIKIDTEFINNIDNEASDSNDLFKKIIGDDVFDLYVLDTNNSQIKNILKKAIENGSKNVESEFGKNNIYILSIKSFSPDSMTKNAENFRQAFEIMHKDISHLIISVVGNGGGWVSLGALVARAIFPSLYPMYGEYSIRKNNVSSAMARLTDYSSFMQMRRTNFYTGEVITQGDKSDMPYWYDEGFDMEFENPKTHEKFTHGFSSLFSFDDDNDITIKSALDKFYSLPGLDLPPNRVALVTDAGCGSTCACFAKHIGETRRAILIGLGGDINKNSEPYDVASFAGGTVESSSDLADAIETMYTPTLKEYFEGITREMKMEMIKDELDNDELYEAINTVEFPSTAYMRFAFHQIYSWKYNEYTKNSRLQHPLEFTPVPVHTVLPIWPSYNKWQSQNGLKKFVPSVLSLLMEIGESDNLISEEAIELKKTLDDDGVVFGKYDVLSYKNEEYCVPKEEGDLKNVTRGGSLYSQLFVDESKKQCEFYDCAPSYYVEPLDIITEDDPNFGFMRCIKRVDTHKGDYENAHKGDTDKKEAEEERKKREESEAKAAELKKSLIAVSIVLAVAIVAAIIFVVLFILVKKNKVLKAKNDTKGYKIINEKLEINKPDEGHEEELLIK